MKMPAWIDVRWAAPACLPLIPAAPGCGLGLDLGMFRVGASVIATLTPSRTRGLACRGSSAPTPLHAYVVTYPGQFKGSAAGRLT